MIATNTQVNNAMPLDENHSHSLVDVLIEKALNEEQIIADIRKAVMSQNKDIVFVLAQKLVNQYEQPQ